MENEPNILLITTDQQRFDTIHALGNPFIYTPHLNWLVDQGITYRRCYSDSPICMPARATLMTGKPGYRTGLVDNKEAIRPMDRFETLPSLLTQNGYQTRAQGKMHFAPMRKNYGFEHMELPMDYHRQRNQNAQLGLPKDHGVGENEVEPVLSTVDESDSLTQWTVKRSIDFLETRDDSRPFFLWTSFTKPHPPFDPCRNYWDLYRDRSVPEPILGDWSRDRAKMPQGLLQPTYTLNNVYRMSPDQLRDMRRAYYACITQIDYALGLLFARLRELDLLENTWILFTTDHGDMLGDHHMGAKSVFLEGSAHIPLLIRPPQASWQVSPMAGQHCDTLVTLADLMPTILNLAGLEIPATCDGVNLLKFLEEPDDDRLFFGDCSHAFFAIIEKNYKYLWTAQGNHELLFDLASDPYEQKNLMPSDLPVGRKLRQKLIEKLTVHAPDRVQNGSLKPLIAPKGPQDVAKWPGFHSTHYPSDVLH